MSCSSKMIFLFSIVVLLSITPCFPSEVDPYSAIPNTLSDNYHRKSDAIASAPSQPRNSKDLKATVDIFHFDLMKEEILLSVTVQNSSKSDLFLYSMTSDFGFLQIYFELSNPEGISIQFTQHSLMGLHLNTREFCLPAGSEKKFLCRMFYEYRKSSKEPLFSSNDQLIFYGDVIDKTFTNYKEKIVEYNKRLDKLWRSTPLKIRAIISNAASRPILINEKTGHISDFSSSDFKETWTGIVFSEWKEIKKE